MSPCEHPSPTLAWLAFPCPAGCSVQVLGAGTPSPPPQLHLIQTVASNPGCTLGSPENSMSLDTQGCPRTSDVRMSRGGTQASVCFYSFWVIPLCGPGWEPGVGSTDCSWDLPSVRGADGQGRGPCLGPRWSVCVAATVQAQTGWFQGGCDSSSRVRSSS